MKAAGDKFPLFTRARAWAASIFGLLAAAAAAAFAVANRAGVALVWSPFHPPLSVPFCLAAFAFLLAGIVLGGVCAWLAAGPARRESRRRQRRIRELEDALESVEKTGAPGTSPDPLSPARRLTWTGR